MFTIVSRNIPRTIMLKKRGVTKFNYPIVICYKESTETKTSVENNEKTAIDIYKMAVQKIYQRDDFLLSSNDDLKKLHVKVWNDLWTSGFSISSSKAEKSINGDRINATIYAVISQLRSYEFEESVSLKKKQEISKALTYAEGCYDAYHTLQVNFTYAK